MYRARTVVNNLVPFIPNAAGRHRFATWIAGAAINKNDTPILLATSTANCHRYSTLAQESFLNGSSSNYVEDMYNAWLADPSSVHAVSS